MIGKVIGGRYELIEKLGEGGMANVYKAKCRILKRFISIKILKQELTNDEEFVRKFKDEAMEVAKLSDNNIVKIYDIGVEDNLHYIVMEYVNGKTLKEYINDNGVLAVKVALDFSIQICNALVVAHEIDLIHRDIKSQNILVSNSGNIKVTDFGIAKSSDSATITNSGKILGSAYYISPEQARGNFVDCRSDIYSFGVVMYEMFVGKLPFTQGTPVNVALQHIQVEPVEPIELVKKLPIGINNLIIKCLQKSPSLRYQSVKELRADLLALQSNKKHFVSKCNSSDKTMVMSPVTSANIEKQTKVKKNGLIKSVMILLISVVVIIFSVFLVNNTGIFSGLSKEVMVPSHVGKIGVDYERELESLGLSYKVSGYVESDLEKDFVVDTYPKQGTEVKKGETVKIVLSNGPELITVPDIVNSTLDKARVVLKNSDLTLGNVEERFSDVYERGKIIIQNPSANSKVNKDEPVSIVVSKGSETKLVNVPEFVGLSLIEAQNLASLNGITIKLIPLDTSKKDLSEKIFYQSIPNGIEIKPTVVVELNYYNYVEEEVKEPVLNSDSLDKGDSLLEDGSLNNEMDAALDEVKDNNETNQENKVDESVPDEPVNDLESDGNIDEHKQNEVLNEEDGSNINNVE